MADYSKNLKNRISPKSLNIDQKDKKYLDDKLMGCNGNKIKGYVFKSFLYKMIEDSGLMIAGIISHIFNQTLNYFIIGFHRN